MDTGNSISLRDGTKLRILQELDPSTVGRETLGKGEGKKQSGGTWKRLVRQEGEGSEG